MLCRLYILSSKTRGSAVEATQYKLCSLKVLHRVLRSNITKCNFRLFLFHSEGHIGLERKVTKLEAMVKMLQEDLKKVGE